MSWSSWNPLQLTSDLVDTIDSEISAGTSYTTLAVNVSLLPVLVCKEVIANPTGQLHSEVHWMPVTCAKVPCVEVRPLRCIQYILVNWSALSNDELTMTSRSVDKKLSKVIKPWSKIVPLVATTLKGLKIAITHKERDGKMIAMQSLAIKNEHYD